MLRRSPPQGLFSYAAYGLGIHSTLALPELVSGEAGSDVVVREGRVDAVPAEGPGARACVRTRAEIDLSWPDVGTISVRNGSEIVIDAAPGTEERVLRLLVLGPALGVLLHQRGLLVLHASAVAFDGHAVAFLGGPRAGKSTTAAALHARGHPLVADDVTPVTLGPGGASVCPGFPQLKLWPEAAVSLGEDLDALPRLHPRLEKRACPVRRGFLSGRLALRHAYVLTEGPVQAIGPIPRGEALMELIRHSYCAPLLKSLDPAAHFLQFGSLARQVPVRRLTRPRVLEALPELARLVETDVAGGSADVEAAVRPGGP